MMPMVKCPWVLITACLLCGTVFSCAPKARRAPAPPIVLTEEHKQVKIVSSTTEINKKLRKHCEIVAVLDGCSDTTLRVKTVEKGGNVAETLCTATSSTTTQVNTYRPYGYGYQLPKYNTDTRTYSSAIIYKCPCEFDIDE